jgi:hypothetical protein
MVVSRKSEKPLIQCNFAHHESSDEITRGWTWGPVVGRQHRNLFVGLLTTLVPRSRIFAEKTVVIHLVRIFPVFYGPWPFNTVFKRALYWIISWANWLRPTSSNPVSLKSILILSFRPTPSDPKWSLPLRFSGYNLVRVSYLFHASYMSTHLTLLIGPLQ